jgi:Cu2+-exporting ATPase
LIRIAVAGAIAGNVMLISFALFGGMFAEMEARFDTLFRWSSLGLTVLALIWPGRVFLTGAYSSVRMRTMHMDVPVALALTVGTVSGAVNTVRGSGETYFESLTSIIFLLLVGRFVLYRQQRAAQDSVELLFSLTPRTARLLEGTTVREVPVEALGTGDRIELRAGDSVPADGTIVKDGSDFDLSLLTGESMPVARSEGDRVYAGTHNLSRRVVLEVDSTGALTRVGRLMALVESFSRDRPPVVRLADRIAHYFVFVVLALAASTASLWAWIDPSAAMENAIAVLIVTCPCALGLATPLALVTAIGQAARRGILIKGGEVVESLCTSGLLLLDKTGTLTRGDLRLQYWKGDDSIRPLVAAVEARVAHPIAHAFVEAIPLRDGAADDVRVTHISGSGVGGQVSGHEILVGSPAYVRGQAKTAPDWLETAERECTEQALSPVLVALDGAIVAVAGLGDTPREDAPEAVAELRAMGWTLAVLSGDDPRLARAIARRIGLDPTTAEGAVSPERKAEIVRERLRNGGPVVMVGDGVNDTAALAAATVGIAVHGGAEASLSAADVFLGRPGLRPLVELIRGSHRAVRVIRRNIAISLMYNLVAGSLAVAGWIDPLIAAILMPVSSLTVVTSSYRSRTFED